MLKIRPGWQKFSKLPLAVVVVGLSPLISGSAWLQSGGNDNQQGPYSDAPLTGAHAENIARLKDLGILDGTECGPGRFCPGEPLSRRTFAVWMVRILDKDQAPGFVDPAGGGKSRFADVSADEPEALFIDRLAELKVTAGCASEPWRYCPDQNVSRSQMASFLARALNLPEAEPANFADVSEKSVHYKNINRLAASKITVGCASKPRRYCPDQPTTRGQMASFLARALDWQSASATVTPTGFDDSIGLTVAYSETKYQATVSWRTPTASKGSVNHYIIQSRTILEDFGSEFYQIVEPQSGKTSYSVTATNTPNHNHLYAFRVIVVYANGQRLATSEVKTPSDVRRLRDVIWEKIVEPNQTDQPWLANTWIHMNDSDRVGLGFGAGRVGLKVESVRPDGLRRVFAGILIIGGREILQNQSTFYTKTVIEEMGHVYTLTNDINKNPASIGIGHLYLHLLSINYGAEAERPNRCGSDELYGDLAKMVFWGRYSDFDAVAGLKNSRDDGVNMNEWRSCGFRLDNSTKSAVDAEVPKIARSVFIDQEIPRWFYDTYQKAGGAIDLEGLWSDIIAGGLPSSTPSLIAYSLRNEFGGYCSEKQVRQFIEGKTAGITNPWRDGGCHDQPTQLVNETTENSSQDSDYPEDPGTGVPVGSFSKRFTMDFIQRFRNRPDKCWVVIDGYVYDVTPGENSYEYPGPGSVTDLCGQNASDHFESNNIDLPPPQYIVGSVRD